MCCFGLFMWWKLIYQGILELSEYGGRNNEKKAFIFIL